MHVVYWQTLHYFTMFLNAKPNVSLTGNVGFCIEKRTFPSKEI